MKAIAIALFVILLGGRSLTAQTLQQVTDNGATTNNGISAAVITTNAPSFSGRNLPSNIDFLNGFRINGSIADASHNGITYQSGGGGGAAISFFRGGNYDTGLDFYTNIDYIPGNLQHRMRIASNGNVGIGTTDPNVPLHVSLNGNNVTSNLTLMASFTNPSGSKGISLGYNQSSQAGIIYSENNTGIGSPLEFWTYNGNSFASRMVFTQSGNLGIGTADPKGYKLAVAGDMIAESVKVQMQGSWPDYVFTNSYSLPTLEETEKHIKEKGHLPGVPSAEDVKVNGIDLGEMNAKLLQKIEELTLHLIELNKVMKKQQSEINYLKKK